jgi:hypothetical protein
LATLGFILGLVAIVVLWLPFAAILVTIVGIVASGLGVRRANRGLGRKRLAVWGLCINLVLLVLGIAYTLFFAAALYSGSYVQIETSP